MKITAAGTVPDFHWIPLLHNPGANIRNWHKKRGKILRFFLGSRIPLEIIEPLHQGFQAGGGIHPLVQMQASFSAIKGN